MVRHLVVVLAVAGLLLLGCGRSEERTSSSPSGIAGPSLGKPGDLLDVARVVAWLRQQPSPAAMQSVELIAEVNPPPSQSQGTLAPPAGCPVFPDRLPTLTDRPFATEFAVAGAILPNPVPADFAALKLAIPYSLGIIDVPSRAHVRGRLFDPAYARCPDAERILVLDAIVEAKPVETSTRAAGQSATNATENWSSSVVSLGLSYPRGWSVEETRNQGAVLEARFQHTDGQRAIVLAITAGPTHWTPAAGGPAPVVLAGDRRYEVRVGEATARLVDATGAEAGAGRERTVRLVFNYEDNTVALSTRFIDGAALDSELLDIFSQMVRSFRFDKPTAVSDPLDPSQNARADIGPGPFIGRDTAAAAAAASSRLTDPKVTDVKLVSEKDARAATPGSCREFPDRPPAVWLVAIRGLLPTGAMTERLVYLDAATGQSICQADIGRTATPTR